MYAITNDWEIMEVSSSHIKRNKKIKLEDGNFYLKSDLTLIKNNTFKIIDPILDEFEKTFDEDIRLKDKVIENLEQKLKNKDEVIETVWSEYNSYKFKMNCILIVLCAILSITLPFLFY